MSGSPRRLGRGLDAILGPRSTTTLMTIPPPAPPPPSAETIRQVPIDRITANPAQPRTTFDESSLQEMADSIRANGVLQPLLLRPGQDGRYELVAGERRWRAARLAGLPSVPAVVRELSDSESLQAALVENLQREDLGPLDRATGYQRYLDTFGVTPEELARRLGQSRANVSNYLRLLKLEDPIREMIASGELAMGQARAIAGIADAARRLAVARLAARRRLSARQVEALAKSDTCAAAPDTPASTDRPSHLEEAERAFCKALGLAVRLLPGRAKNSGRIIIRYNGLEEFDRVADRLGASVYLE